MAAFAASIYPALTGTLLLLFPGERLPTAAHFLFVLTTGAYLAQMPAVLSDTLFVALFSAGLYFGLRAAARGSWPSFAAAVLLSGYAFQVRVTLALVPVAVILFQAYVARRHGVLGRRRVKAIIAASFVSLLMASQLPALRNYAHYRMYQSTDLFGSNLVGYLALPVLHKAGRDDVAGELVDAIEAIPSIKERVAFQKRQSLDIVKRHPLLTAQILAKSTLPTAGRPKGRLYELLERWTVPRAAQVIAVSASLRSELLGWAVPADRIAIVPNGVRSEPATLGAAWPRLKCLLVGDGRLEAQLRTFAAGRPIVASRVGGIPEVLVHGGSGLLVAPSDVPGLAAALGSLLRDPRQAQLLGRQAAATVRQRYGLPAMVEGTRQAYAAAIKRPAPGGASHDF